MLLLQTPGSPGEEDNVVEHLQDNDVVEEDKNAIADEIIAEWKFFVVPVDITRAILSLNERIGSEYLKMEYEKLGLPINEDRDIDDSLGDLKSDGDIREGLDRARKILFHEGEHANDFTQPEDEILSSFQTLFSERIFNHLAMLSRSRYASEGTYSILEELTIELAEKIGLGMYLHHKTAPDLRAEAERILFRLALEFQRWFIQKHQCLFFATWGALCTVETWEALGGDYKNAVVMETDVDDPQSLDSDGLASIGSRDRFA